MWTFSQKHLATAPRYLKKFLTLNILRTLFQILDGKFHKHIILILCSKILIPQGSSISFTNVTALNPISLQTIFLEVPAQTESGGYHIIDWTFPPMLGKVQFTLFYTVSGSGFPVNANSKTRFVVA